MNLFTIFTRFPDHESCIEHLERVRFAHAEYCPLCGGTKVARKADGHRVGRWNCRDCKSSFNVLSGTIFQQTKIELQKWFCAIGLIVNAKKSLSSCQLGRDLDLNQKSAWYMQQRIRAEMGTKEGSRLMRGIVEADETYIGGKPRYKGQSKRGRGTNKTAVLGVVERGGIVAAKVTDSVSGKSILAFIKDHVDSAESVLMTDEFSSYRPVRKTMRHAVINHSSGVYAEGITHTNTIEGYWALLKRAWYGSHHHYSKKFTPLYIAEQSWKYNNRANKNAFGTFIAGCFA